MRKILFTAMVLFFGTTLFAQNIDVVFNVDMSVQITQGNFNPGSGDFVVVRGSFQMAAGDTANWYGTVFTLADAGSNIYSVTAQIPASLAGTNYAFKYVTMPGDGWEGVSDRPFTLSGTSPQVLPTVFFNDDNGAGTTYTIEFIADINNILNIGAGGAFDPNQDSLMLMGLDWEGGTNVTGAKKLQNLNPFNPGEYTTTLTVDATGDSTKWKFKAEPGNRFSNDGWEAGNDNWFVYGTETSVTIGPVVPRIFPLFPPIPSDVNLTFNVDMTGAINQWNGLPIPLNEIEFVGLRGGADFLGNWSSGCWCPDDTTTGNMKVLTDMGNNMYQYNTIVPAGTNGGNFEYKFAVMYPGADTINGGSQPLDNEGGFGRNHAFILSGQELTVVNNNQWGVFTPTDVERIEDLTPYAYQLEQNYPNPFNPSTVIKYSIPEAGFVTLKVFNLLGQEVATLVNNEQATGVYQATFDASQLSSGIYFYSLETKNFTSTKKMLLMK